VIGLDSNIVVRLLLVDSIRSDDAPEQIRLIKELLVGSGETFFVNHVVIAETIWVLRNKAARSKEAVTAIVERLLSSFNVEVDRRAMVEAALASYASRAGDFADHLTGKINHDAGCSTTLTFDKAAARSPDFTELRRFRSPKR
jgi:predicted nucleic-acid-binding protein